jgi:flagellar motor switch protein FliM
MADELSDDERQTLLAKPLPPNAPSASPPGTLDSRLKRALASLCEHVAAEFAAELSTLARRSVRVNLAGLGTIAWGEFVARLANPVCLNALSAAPLAQRWLLEIGPAVLFPLFDCMLGGGQTQTPAAARPLTEIERRLAARVAGSFVNQLRAAFLVAELDLVIERQIGPRDLAGIMKPDESVLAIRFEIDFRGGRGTLNLGIPLAAISTAADRLTGTSASVDQPNARSAQPTDAHPAVELVACLAQSTIVAVELAALAVGDVITTEKKADAPITVLVDGIPRFQASVGALDGRKAIRIEEQIPEH